MRRFECLGRAAHLAKVTSQRFDGIALLINLGARADAQPSQDRQRRKPAL